MSITAIKPWFQKRFYALEFEEHKSGFNVDNIGELDIDRKYHIRIRAFSGGSINHTDQSTVSEVTTEIFFKGGSDSYDAIDTAVYEIEQLIKECCNIRNRTSDGILNVVFSRAEINPRGDSNDSSVLVTMDFLVTVLIGVEETTP